MEDWAEMRSCTGRRGCRRTLDFGAAKDNVVFLGPPGTGKTHLVIGLAIRACQAGHRVLLATASQWPRRNPIIRASIRTTMRTRAIQPVEM